MAGVGGAGVAVILVADRLVNQSGRTIPDALAEMAATTGHRPAVAELVAFVRSTVWGATARMVGAGAADD